VLLGALIVAVAVGAYWGTTRSSARSGPEQQDALMKTGLDLLYTKKDAAGAAAQFRRVLELNPTHYGATYQLAVALDRSGRPNEAQPYWEKMLRMAGAINDQPTLATVRRRLGSTPPAGEEPVQWALMNSGLDALYSKNDPNAAAARFRQVLDRNPTHYGATYQLAKALDQAGKPADARPLWEKVVKMAEGYKDERTLAAARTRLEKKP
jgi:tetratricopeptide (TPR) repeat protein